MKPVKLEFLFDDKTGKGFQSVGDNITSTKDKLNLLIGVQKSYIAEIKNTLESTKKAFSSSQNVNEVKNLSATLVETEKELKEAEVALGMLEMGMQDNGDEASTLRTRIMNLKNEMARMTEGTEEYRDAMQRLGQMQDQYGDITQQGRVLADDEKNIRATADAVAGLSGAMTAGVGIASLFGAEQEKLQQIQTRLQAVMATTIGLQQVAETLNKDSYFSIVLLGGAKKKWAAAQALLNTQLGIGVGLSKALMVSGIGVLLAGIAALVVVYDKWRKKQEEVNSIKKEFAEIEVEAAKGMAEEKVKMEQLHRVASDQAKNLELRKKAIKEIKTLMPDYNGHIDKEGVLIDNANTALKQYLVTLYKVEKAKKLIADIEQKQGTLDAMDKEGSKSLSFIETFWIGLNRSFNPKAGDKVMKDLIARNSKTWADGMEKLKSDIEAKNIEFNSLIDDKSVFDALFTDKGGGSATTKNTVENQLSQQRLDALRQINEKRVELMKEGEEKRKAQAKIEYDNTLAEIAKEKAARERHVKELQKAKIPVSEEEITAIDTQSNQQAVLAKQQYDATIRQVDTETANQYKAIQNELRMNFETRLNQQLADTGAYYNELRSKARGNAALLVQINNAYLQEKKRIESEAALSEIQIAESIAMRRASIQDGQLRLATDREEILLKIQLNSAKERLAKLKELEQTGAASAGDVEQAKVQVEELSAALQKMPLQRIAEITDMIQQGLSGIGDFASAFDEDLGNLTDMISGAVGGVSNLGMGIASGNPQQIIQGSVELLQTAGKLIRANKEANEEIRKFNINLAQQAIDYSLAVIKSLKDVKSETDNLFTENYTNTLAQGMSGYSAAIDKQVELMNKLGDASVKTGVKKKKFLGITYGTRDVYSSLLATYPDLLKKDGTLNRELAETLQQSGNLNDETSNLIDNILSAADAAQEAMSQVEDVLGQLVGDLGTQLKEVLDEAFASGTDSAKEMKENVVSMMKDIATQNLFNAVFGSLFSQLESKMKESYGENGDMDITDELDWFMSNYPSLVDSYNSGLEELQKRIKEAYGLDPFAEESSRTASAKGIAQASQDSVDENNGRLTNIQMMLAKIVSIQDEYSVFIYKIFDPVNRIADNTDRLEAIEKSMSGVKEDIGKIVREGIILKR
ncbi:MAG TPA: hypothetical protein DDW85_00660 [Porphyromonadaceae bacterium]|nr:hypothetical protein [Porphyromonadaceae bacterium]